MKKIAKFIIILMSVILASVALFLGFFTATSYYPKDIENVDISEDGTKKVSLSDSVSILVWNIGYSALGESADFFMDGGTNIRSSSKETVINNLININSELISFSPDIILLQEVDTDAKRSYHIDEARFLSNGLNEYCSSFAYNFKSIYIPYPIPETIGKVNAGLLTLSKLNVSEAERIQLPIPFKWPISTVNMKRALLVSYIPIEGTDKQLVIVNLHLEAYDDGEGKKQQTEQLKNLLISEYEKGNYVIAAGDFNQTFSNADTSQYPVYQDNWKAGLIDTKDFEEYFTMKMDDTVPSCRLLNMPYEGSDKSTFQYYLLDGVIVSKNLTIDSIGTIDLDFKYSDHNPLSLQVSFK